jgi:creatinine amidohydrolase
MNGLLRIQDITGGELDGIAKRADFAVLPIGAIEWHGPHLALGTDLVLAEGFATTLTEAPWTAVAYPAVPYSACPGQTRGWPGTVSVRPEIAVGYMCDVLAGIVRAGFPRVLILNGHDANMSVARAAMEWVSGQYAASFLLCNWFQLVTPAETARLFGDDVVARGHGGAYETAGLLGVGGVARLDAVTDLPPRPPLATPHPHALVESRPDPFDGWSGHISRVTDGASEEIREIVTRRLRELIATWLASPAPHAPYQSNRSSSM